MGKGVEYTGVHRGDVGRNDVDHPDIGHDASGGGEPHWWGAELLARHPDDAVWAQASGEVTYRELRAQVAAQRRLFQAHGIRSGAAVALQGSQSFSQLWSVFALWSLGAQVMVMGPEMRGRELGRLLDRCRPQFYISFRGTGPTGRSFQDECEIFVRRLKGGHPATSGHTLVHFTSGSTGFAKAVVRSPRSLLNELAALRRIDGIPGPGSRVLLLGSVAHSFTLVGGLLHHMDIGAVSLFPTLGTRSMVPGHPALRSDADAVLGAPRHFTALALSDRPVRLPRLQSATSGGDRLDGQVQTRFAERHGVRIGQAYGTTETGIVAADPTGRFAPHAVGTVAPHVQVRIVDGELHIRMSATPYPGAGEGCLGRQEGPACFLADGAPGGPGWLRTRDRAELDARSGALRILGRCDPPVDRHQLTCGTDHVLLSERAAFRALTREGTPLH